MRVDIVVLSVNQAALLEKLFASAKSVRHSIFWRVYLHGATEEVWEVCDAACHTQNQIVQHGDRERSVAASWNEGMLLGYRTGADVVLILNDDVEFSPGDLDILAEYAHEHREHFVVFCEGLNPRKKKRMWHNWAAFAYNPIALEKLGCFDQNFFPVGGEDIDYMTRATALGLSPGYAKGTSVTHHVAITRLSADLRALLVLAQHANREYYTRKWGIPWGVEGKVYRNPFNDTRFGVRIDPADRASPYPGYNRRRA